MDMPPWIFLAWIFERTHACVLGTGARTYVGFGSSRARSGDTLQARPPVFARAYSSHVRRLI